MFFQTVEDDSYWLTAVGCQFHAALKLSSIICTSCNKKRWETFETYIYLCGYFAENRVNPSDPIVCTNKYTDIYRSTNCQWLCRHDGSDDLHCPLLFLPCCSLQRPKGTCVTRLTPENSCPSNQVSPPNNQLSVDLSIIPPYFLHPRCLGNESVVVVRRNT